MATLRAIEPILGVDGVMAEARHTVRTNLGILALLAPSPGVPDPIPHRARVAAFLARLPGQP